MTKPEWRETEKRDPQYDGIEDWETVEILTALAAGQAKAISAVMDATAPLAKAVDAAAARLKGSKGRIVYAGAGTSGRLAILDGVELTPTFGWPPERCVFLFAGGMAGLQKAVEGAEDDRDAAQRDVYAESVGPDDVVLGLAASGTTPYTRTVLQAARSNGALTIALANNPNAPMLDDAEHGILLQTGAEVLAGSTRLGAGTSQKAALNLFSTALMARLNKIHRGYMIDVLTTNDKLVARAERMVVDLTGCALEEAQTALKRCDYHVKSAVLVVSGCEPEEAQQLLDAHEGHLGRALAAIRPEQNGYT